MPSIRLTDASIDPGQSSSTGEPSFQPWFSARWRKLVLSYLPDWAVTILLAAASYSLGRVDGYKRLFSVEDTSLRYPFAEHERVPSIALFFVSFVAPLVIMPVVNAITIKSLWDLHNSILGLILSLSLAGTITQFTKLTVGRPRPDILSRCQPHAGTADPPFGLSSVAVCTNTNAAIMRDGFRSFPSGHSSSSFAGLGFLAFYLAGKMHLFDRRGHAVKAWVALAPFSGAALVAISRTMDYRHHWQDVLIGSILGTVVAYFTYRQYYPSLAAQLSHRPYSARIKQEETQTLPLHNHHYQVSVDSQPSNPPNQDLLLPHTRLSSEDYELQGTVKRTDTSLAELWQDGGYEFSQERSVPSHLPRQTT